MARVLLADKPIFRQTAIGMVPSWQCDAKCSHCYIPVRERKRDVFDEEVMKKALRGLPEGIRWIVFTGGEPFQHPERLFSLVRLVSSTRRLASVVTNGVWARDWGRAEELLASARRCGLLGLTVSVDEYHRPSLPLKTVSRLLKHASEMGFVVSIVGVGKKSRKEISQLDSDELSLSRSGETNLFDLENVGSASSLKIDRVQDVNLGGCQVAMEPMIAPDGDVFACCSCRLFEIQNPVLLRGNVMSRPVEAILGEASRDYLLSAVAALGPKGLLKLLGRSVTGDAGSRCDLCLALLNDAEVVATLRKRIRFDKELRKELVGRHIIYDQCYRPSGMKE